MKIYVATQRTLCESSWMMTVRKYYVGLLMSGALVAATSAPAEPATHERLPPADEKTICVQEGPKNDECRKLAAFALASKKDFSEAVKILNTPTADWAKSHPEAPSQRSIPSPPAP